MTLFNLASMSFFTTHSGKFGWVLLKEDLSRKLFYILIAGNPGQTPDFLFIFSFMKMSNSSNSDGGIILKMKWEAVIWPSG